MADSDNNVVNFPQKRYYRQRAHTNPIADHCIDYPCRPKEMDWASLYPYYFGEEAVKESIAGVEFADVGCGYGGLLATLADLYPDTLMLGMEIRVKVADFVMDRVKALRHNNPGKYHNIACVRSNAMKYLPNYFEKGQLSKMFFLYPDPHFKKSKHKWRIISPPLLAEYAYVLREGGIIYTITDVEDLHEWIVKHMTEHPLFTRISEIELNDDPVIPKLTESTEEGQKVSRNNGNRFMAVFRRVADPYPSELSPIIFK